MAFLIVVLSASFFTWSLPTVEAFRERHPEAIFAIPLLVLFIWWDRRKPADVLSTREDVASLQTGEARSPARRVTLAAGFKQIFFTLIAHTVGASVGREAVGIQLGAWAARLRSARGWYYAACLATGFSIVLGTPFAAAIFIFESKRWKLSWTDWLAIPLFAWLGYQLSILLGVTHVALYPFAETVGQLYAMGEKQFAIFAALLLIAVMAASLLFLTLVRVVQSFEISTPFKLGFALSALVAVTAALYVYGFDGAEANGLTGLGTKGLYSLWTLDSEALTTQNHPLFLAGAKILLTAIFVGIGVRGGELTPLLVIGAMIAAGLAVALSLPVVGVVAIGFPLVWGIAARRPVTAAAIALELFGFAPWGTLGLIVFTLCIAGIKCGDGIDGLVTRYIGLRPRRLWRRGLYDN